MARNVGTGLRNWRTLSGNLFVRPKFCKYKTAFFQASSFFYGNVIYNRKESCIPFPVNTLVHDFVKRPWVRSPVWAIRISLSSTFIEETKNLFSKDFCFANLIFKAYDTLLNLEPNSVMEANHSVYPHENPVLPSSLKTIRRATYFGWKWALFTSTAEPRLFKDGLR